VSAGLANFSVDHTAIYLPVQKVVRVSDALCQRQSQSGGEVVTGHLIPICDSAVRVAVCARRVRAATGLGLL
jgi:hypothetical protein